jgi:formamidopyrimidine-DNA glycosylase
VKEQEQDEKRLKLEVEVVGGKGLTLKNWNRQQSFITTQNKRQQRYVKLSVLVGEPSSDTFQTNVRRKKLKCRKKR